MVPGAPYAPPQAPARRVFYAIVAVVLGTLVSLGNGLVLANEPVLAGARGDDLVSTAMLPGVYIAFDAAANLILVKARAQFGISAFIRVLLFSYAAAAMLMLLVPAQPTAILLSAVSGTCAAGMTTLTVYYAMQSLPASAKPLGPVAALGVVQFGSPLARFFPVDLFSLGGWRTLALLQIAIPLTALVAIIACPLPPTDRSKAFDRLDGLTYPLVLTANLLLCIVLGEGRLLWWGDTPWLGRALAGCIPLYVIAVILECRRRNPLLHFEWYGTSTILRFAAMAVVVRLALSEQSYGAVGLLNSAGLDNDQFHTLFASIILAQILGTAVAFLTTNIERPPYQVVIAALFIAFGAWLDTGSDNLTRPGNLILSQSLIAFGTTLFIGPVFVYGSAQMRRRGPDHLVSLVVLFSMTQNVGGLAGSALLGSYQIARAKVHAAALADAMPIGNPMVVERIRQGAAALSGVIGDPNQLAAQGGGLLGQSLSREAAILGFNDAFALITFVALGAALFLAGAIARHHWLERLAARKGASS